MHIDDLYRLLRASHIQAQGIVDTVTDPLVVLDGELVVQNASRSFFEIFRVDRFETIGRPFHELGNGQLNIPDLRRLLVEVLPRASAIIDYAVELELPERGLRNMLLSARTLANSGNSSNLMLLSIVDVTEFARKSASKDILFAEMRHRVKNLLAIAEALARTSSVEGKTAAEFRDKFLSRFRALTDALDIAFGGTSGNELGQMMTRVLAPFAGEDAVEMELGLDMPMDPEAIVTLSLVIHELATNAAKYGAFSVPEGKVHISWKANADDGTAQITWVERGGPPVVKPVRKGHGTRLIESSINYTLQGRLETSYDPVGLNVGITVPLPGELVKGRAS